MAFFLGAIVVVRCDLAPTKEAPSETIEAPTNLLNTELPLSPLRPTNPALCSPTLLLPPTYLRLGRPLAAAHARGGGEKLGVCGVRVGQGAGRFRTIHGRREGCCSAKQADGQISEQPGDGAVLGERGCCQCTNLLFAGGLSTQVGGVALGAKQAEGRATAF